MIHEHVRIAVTDADPPGTEKVPARRLENDEWELLRSPLFAMEVASGDVIRVVNSEVGSFEIVKRGGNVCVQFYLGEAEADDADATARAAAVIESKIATLGGRIDGTTPGLVSSTVSVDVGFSTIEAVFNEAAGQRPGAQWQYGNIYDPTSGKSLDWWV